LALLRVLSPLPFPHISKRIVTRLEEPLPELLAVEDIYNMAARVQNCRGGGKWRRALTLQITSPFPSTLTDPHGHTFYNSTVRPCHIRRAHMNSFDLYQCGTTNKPNGHIT